MGLCVCWGVSRSPVASSHLHLRQLVPTAVRRARGPDMGAELRKGRGRGPREPAAAARAGLGGVGGTDEQRRVTGVK